MKRLLMVAFHYPPASGTSGVQRALRFSSHLGDFGWKPIILSANPRAYQHVSDDLMASIPPEVTVIRAAAWDTRRHLSLRGRYPLFLALPDRWSSWALGAIPAGLRAIRRLRPAAIWSTYPIATAHRIGSILARSSKLPYIADFRDPMAQDDYPEEPAVWRSFERIERQTIAEASLSTFTTPGAVSMYRERYPDRADCIRLVENGYDEATFSQLLPNEKPLHPGRRTLLHSGIMYPSERDPDSLFAALRELAAHSPAHFDRLVIRFRAPVHDSYLLEIARRHGVERAIEILPGIPYADAICEMQRADGLLIMQSYNCNAQIPAKFYEYLRAGPPIVVVADPTGDTAGAARASGITEIGEFENPASILATLTAFVESRCSAMLPAQSAVSGASRYARTAELAAMLDELVQNDD